MTDKLNLKNKQGMLAYFNDVKNDMNATETALKILMSDYVYGGFDNFIKKSTLDDMSQKEIYWFILEKAVDIVNQGSIYGKWLIGKELIHSEGFLSQDKALGRFLIEFSAHEGLPEACDYMAEKYHHLNFGDRDIVIYWQNRSQNNETINKIGIPLPIDINSNNSETFDGSLWRTIRLKSEPIGEWDGFSDLIKPIK